MGTTELLRVFVNVLTASVCLLVPLVIFRSSRMPLETFLLDRLSSVTFHRCVVSYFCAFRNTHHSHLSDWLLIFAAASCVRSSLISRAIAAFSDFKSATLLSRRALFSRSATISRSSASLFCARDKIETFSCSFFVADGLTVRT